MDSPVDDREAVSLYLDLRPNERVDLEVAAMAVIEWCRAIKAASVAVDPDYQYRVMLIAAEPGSSKWLAKVEKSRINQLAKDIEAGWKEVPLLFRAAVALAVVIPVTLYPTIDFYFGDKGFSEAQIEQLESIFDRASSDPAVIAHKKAMFREVQRDPNIIALGGGVPDRPDWRPREMIPAGRFAEADGLFEALETEKDNPDAIYQTIDVILDTPRLENARRSWTFRQPGIPGKFNAEMKDVKFLAALASGAIRERLRANIPMRIRLETKYERVNGELRVKRRGRSVVEVISPSPEPSE